MNQVQSSSEENPAVDRRSFLQWLFGFSIFSTIASIAIPIIGYLIPPESGNAVGGGRVLVGTTDEIPHGQAKVVPVGNKPVIITNTDQGIKAFSAICTHLGCICVWDASRSIILCPCHDGHFSASTGAVLAGPPPTPLASMDILVEDNEIYVLP